MKPYGLISDTHHHNWTAFASVNANGINNRLQQILDETLRAGDAVLKAGGDTLVHAGDLFHVRGSVAPSVLNPTLEAYKKLIDSGLKVILVAGNHDLEGREANDLGSAMTALREIGCQVVNHFDSPAYPEFCLVPWEPSVSSLKHQLTTLASSFSDVAEVDLILHAGIDGVIKGLPPHGLDADFLSKLGFRRVFAGHYHHHKQLAPNVWSIGALTHQTWSDIGTKAGFVIVSDAGVKWHSTHAPNFVEIDGATSADDIPLIVDGNYVRAKVFTSKTAEIEALRKFLHDSGALGVTIVAQPSTGVTRTSSSIKAGASVSVSVADYIAASDFENKKELAVLCEEILKCAQEAA
jgi:DNA repair exonuclease SbcCD nuclease subunit